MLCPETEPNAICDWTFAMEISRDKQRQAEYEAASLLTLGKVEQARNATTSALAYKKVGDKFEQYLREVEARVAEVEGAILALARTHPDQMLLLNYGPSA